MRRLWAIGIAALVGCSGSAERSTDPKPPVKPRVKPAEPPSEPVWSFPSGTFNRVGEARKITDNCGNMQWESDAIKIDADARTLHSTPDDRLYAAEIDGDDLVAKGLFDPRSECGNETYTEIWRLEKRSGDELFGYVTTYSHFNSTDCLHACKAVFSVRVVRAE